MKYPRNKIDAQRLVDKLRLEFKNAGWWRFAHRLRIQQAITRICMAFGIEWE